MLRQLACSDCYILGFFYQQIKYKIMSKQKGFCDVCGTEIEVNMCCSGHECGCMGLPTEPPVCSEKCYDTFMSQEYQDNKKAKSEFVFLDLKTIKLQRE